MVYSHGSSIFADALIKLLYYRAEKDKVRRQLIETNETDQWSRDEKFVPFKRYYCE